MSSVTDRAGERKRFAILATTLSHAVGGARGRGEAIPPADHARFGLAAEDVHDERIATLEDVPAREHRVVELRREDHCARTHAATLDRPRPPFHLILD